MTVPAPRLVTWENGTDLVIEMPVTRTPAEVWEVLVDGSAAGAWFAPFTAIEETVSVDLGGESAMTGEILSCEAEEHVLVEFPDFGVLGVQLLPVDVVPDLPADAATEIAALAATGQNPAGTVIVFTQSAPDEVRARQNAADFGPMWDTHLRMLARTLGIDVAEAEETDLDALYSALDLEIDDADEDALGDPDLGDDDRGDADRLGGEPR